MKRAVTRFAPLVALALLAACARPLTPAETDAARALFGDTLDTGAVTVTAGLGLRRCRASAPRSRAAGRRHPAAQACASANARPGATTTWPAAFVLYDAIFFSHKFYRADTFARFPRQRALSGVADHGA